MAPEARKPLRYFLVTHGNDGVGHFGPDLLIQQPDWLGEPETRPPGVPKSEKWITPTSFFQTLIDMKNAMNVVPGQFDANGHDYRGDLARFVREAYALECSDEQLQSVEEALRRYELLRQGRMEFRSRRRTIKRRRPRKAQPNKIRGLIPRSMPAAPTGFEAGGRWHTRRCPMSF